MLKKIALTAGLTLVAGTSVAATTPNDVNIGMDSNLPVSAQFDMLDRNDDGVISQAEAQASSELTALYATFDTSATLEAEASSNATTNGLTRAQFEAGIQAMDSGVIGPAASGGQTYILLQNGTRVDKAEWNSYRQQHNSRQPMSNYDMPTHDMP